MCAAQLLDEGGCSEIVRAHIEMVLAVPAHRRQCELPLDLVNNLTSHVRLEMAVFALRLGVGYTLGLRCDRRSTQSSF